MTKFLTLSLHTINTYVFYSNSRCILMLWTRTQIALFTLVLSDMCTDSISSLICFGWVMPWGIVQRNHLAWLLQCLFCNIVFTWWWRSDFSAKIMLVMILACTLYAVSWILMDRWCDRTHSLTPIDSIFYGCVK